MRIKIEPHRDYQCLKPEEATALYDMAKRLLRVGFEIEFNATDDFDVDPDENRVSTSVVNELLATIQGKFETRYAFTMAIGKHGMNMKKLKRVFSDGNTRIEVPLEIDIDGYLEHLPVPYGYYDGSTPVELVTSPVEPSIEAVRDIFSKVYDVVESIDHVPLMPNCHRDCGLHQTVVFEHLKPKFPEIVVANTIQMAVEMDYSTAKDRRNAVRRIATRIQKTYAQTNKLLQEHGYIWRSSLTKFVPMKG